MRSSRAFSASTLQAGTDGAASNLVNLIEESQLERTLSDGLQGMPGLRPGRAARALIKQLRGRNFMLCFMGGGNYAFVHRTFLEYFCAEAIVDRFQVDQTLTLDALKTEIFGHWPDESWHEVLRLVAGRLAPKFVKEILDWLLQQQDPNQSCNHIFLAARCVGDVRNRGELGSTEERVMHCTRDLTKIGLGSSSTPMTRPEEVTQVKAVLEQAVALVADVWKDNKETLPWLKELAQSHQNEYVRSNAVRPLVMDWKDDPDTQMILKVLTQSDVNWEVRMYAIWGLSLQEDRTDTLKILKECAQSDEAWVVHLCAVGILSDFVKGNPDILAILKELAQFDEDDNVRKFSAQMLAHFQKDGPEEALAFLKSLYQVNRIWLE
jgi:hypothetical protein